ncbi:hypothetical protein GCM10010430_69910 [Kitasatospora cystarginea]|uniref:Uncharacterized protein n=1 Tax=Kitasatospora cystarginea TaxID=58350 RepID=A0ABN3EVT5_9ACTN
MTPIAPDPIEEPFMISPTPLPENAPLCVLGTGQCRSPIVSATTTVGSYRPGRPARELIGEGVGRRARYGTQAQSRPPGGRLSLADAPSVRGVRRPPHDRQESESPR